MLISSGCDIVSIDFLLSILFCKCFILAEMTTKFNKDMYAKMRSKKYEPLSNIGKKWVCVTGRVLQWLQSRLPLPSSLLLRRWGQPLLLPLLKRSQLLPRRGCACQAGKERRLILIRPPCEATRASLWTKRMGSWRLRTWRPLTEFHSMWSQTNKSTSSSK